jgi:hypothetical protein
MGESRLDYLRVEGFSEEAALIVLMNEVSLRPGIGWLMEFLPWLTLDQLTALATKEASNG